MSSWATDSSADDGADYDGELNLAEVSDRLNDPGKFVDHSEVPEDPAVREELF